MLQILKQIYWSTFIKRYQSKQKYCPIYQVKKITFHKIIILKNIKFREQNNIPKRLGNALNILKKKNYIIITKADKGEKIVIMDKDF